MTLAIEWGCAGCIDKNVFPVASPNFRSFQSPNGSILFSFILGPTSHSNKTSAVMDDDSVKFPSAQRRQERAMGASGYARARVCGVEGRDASSLLVDRSEYNEWGRA
jgi:hypothetical protein